MKRSHVFFGLVGAFALLSSLGAGCFSSQVPQKNEGSEAGTAAATSTVRGIASGDAVILEEQAGVVGGKYKNGPLTRRVTLTDFAMGKTSNAAWELADASGTKLVSGRWEKAGLLTAHPFFLPAVFDSKARPVVDAAVLWLAREEYRELSGTRGTTIDPGFDTVSDWVVRMKANPGADKAFTALRQLIQEATDARKDLTYAKIEGERGEKTLLQNGKEVSVPVVHLRNWYGTFDVLDRPENPLVLSFTLDPQVPKTRLDVSKGDGAEMAKLMNYRVKEIILGGK